MVRAKRLSEKERFWRSMVEQQRQGGLTIRAFCREKGISEPSFYGWRKELQRRDAQRSTAAGSFAGRRVAAGHDPGRLIPVEVIGGRRQGGGASDGHHTKEPLEIGTPGGFTLRFDQDTRPETVLCLLEVITRCCFGGGASC